MTCIVGLEHDGRVWMGGDSASPRVWEMSVTRLRKVFSREGFLIGYTTSFRMGQLLQYSLEVEKQAKGQCDLEYMATMFIDSVRHCFDKGGFSKIEHSQEEGGEFLVGYKSRLYVIQSDFQVNSPLDGFYAVGCGAPFALGSMGETGNRKPKTRIRRALKAASRFSNGVCAPYHIIMGVAK